MPRVDETLDGVTTHETGATRHEDDHGASLPESGRRGERRLADVRRRLAPSREPGEGASRT
jgi:hypothetical protein